MQTQRLKHQVVEISAALLFDMLQQFAPHAPFPVGLGVIGEVRHHLRTGLAWCQKNRSGLPWSPGAAHSSDCPFQAPGMGIGHMASLSHETQKSYVSLLRQADRQRRRRHHIEQRFEIR